METLSKSDIGGERCSVFSDADWSSTILRLLMAVVAGVSGLYGMLILSLVVLGHLC